MNPVTDKWIFAVVLIYCLIIQFGALAQNPPEDGSPCTSNVDCDETTTFMECVIPENVCRCKNPSATYFETVDKKCHQIVGEYCQETNLMECPMHGWCDTVTSVPYICQCVVPYLETVSKRCAIPHGEQCTSNSDCNYGGFVQCLPGTPQTCGCDPATSKYDPDTEQCFFTLNADCLDPTDTVPHQLCAPGSDCTNEGDGLKCHCFAGSSDNGLGECRANQGEECDANVLCNDAKYLDCVNDVCGCDPAKHKLHDGNGGCMGDFEAECDDGSFCGAKPFLDCINKKCDCKGDLENAGGVCTSKFGGSCVEGEPCHTDKWVDCVSGICACDVGKHMIPDGNGDGCTGDFEALCDQGQPCDDRKFLDCIGNDKCDCRSDLVNMEGVCTSNMGGTCEHHEPCNADKWLKCIDKICTCDTDDHMVGDGNGGCIGQINAPCNEGQSCDKGSFLDCIDGLTCNCKDGMAADINEICKSKFEGPCADGEPCDESKFLTCDPKDQKCRCPIDETIDVGAGDCKALYHKPCDVAGIEAPDCDLASNLECVAGQCECLPGSIPIDGGRCGAKIGSDCTSDTDCGTGNFLECGDDNTCVCKAGFDPVNNVCLGSYGTPCDENGVTCNIEKFWDCDPESKVCACLSDLEDVGGGDCRALFGGACGTGQPECHDAAFLNCDANGHCACIDTLTDNGKGGCRADLNTSCAVGPCNEDQFTVCSPEKICVCRSDLHDNGVECVAGFSGTCSGGVKCDDAQFLTCNPDDNKCHCRLDHIDIGKGECKSQYGQECNTNGQPDCDTSNYITCDDANKCVCNMTTLVFNGHGGCRLPMMDPNSICDPDKPPSESLCDETNFAVCGAVSKVCECQDGTIPIGTPPNVICKAKFEESCAHGEPCEGEFHECSPDGKCRCRSGLFDIGGGKCRSLFGGSCGAGEPDCDVTNFLTCKADKCVCEVNLEPNAEKKCRALYGSSCADGEKCDNFLVCDAVTKKCQCKEGQVDNGMGNCRQIFDGFCSPEEGLWCDENAFLTCENRKCTCGPNAMYDDVKKMCLLLPNSACNADNFNADRQMCTSNSYCLPLDDSSSSGLCACIGDLHPNADRKCVLLAGQSCNPFSDQCDHAEFQRCDPDTIKCACIQVPNLIEEGTGRCRLLPDTECSTLEGAQPCTSHASCIEVEDEGWCLCDAGFMVNSAGRCVIGYGQVCGMQTPGSCDTEGFQSCQPPDVPEGQCKCSDSDSMVYDSQRRKCFVKADHACSLGSLFACTQHATCNESVCMCDAGYIADSHGRCAAQEANQMAFSEFWKTWAGNV